MAWYKQGTIAVSGTAVTGTGTNWTDNKMGVGEGQALLIPGAGVVKMYEIKRVNSAASITLASDAGIVAAGSAYAIMSFYTESRPDFNRRLSALLSYYQSQMDGWQQIMTSDGTITLETPNGQQVTISSFKKLTSDMGKKLEAGAFGLGSQYGNALTNSDLAGYPVAQFFRQGGGAGENEFGGFGSGIVLPYNATNSFQIYFRNNINSMQIRRNLAGAVDSFVLYGTGNTTRASDGTIKAASPAVKIFSDGQYETNCESEGVSVERISAGQYLINGCVGLNADAAWGGIDGGFDIPTDRNRQPLIWLDYEVNADGSVLVKTYHRTHPDSPAFARNEIDGLNDGDPVDIPSDQFVSVRVNMPLS